MNYPPATYIDSDDEDEYNNQKAILESDIGPDINNQNNQNRKVITLSPYDPKYHHRTLYTGMHFEGKCANLNCSVKGKKVWVSLGFGTMFYAEKLYECQCPICKVELKPENILHIGYRYAAENLLERKCSLKTRRNKENQSSFWVDKTCNQPTYKIDECHRPPAIEMQLPQVSDIEYQKILSQQGLRGGIYFQGFCTNRKCAFSFKTVWVPLGYGAFFFGEKIYECPCPYCAVPINPESIKKIAYCVAKIKLVGRTLNGAIISIQDELNNRDMGIYTVKGPFLKIQAEQL